MAEALVREERLDVRLFHAGEEHARAVAERPARRRRFEARPHDLSPARDGAFAHRQRDLHHAVRLERSRRNDLCARRRQIDELRGAAVDLNLQILGEGVPARPPRRVVDGRGRRFRLGRPLSPGGRRCRLFDRLFDLRLRQPELELADALFGGVVEFLLPRAFLGLGGSGRQPQRLELGGQRVAFPRDHVALAQRDFEPHGVFLPFAHQPLVFGIERFDTRAGGRVRIAVDLRRRVQLLGQLVPFAEGGIGAGLGFVAGLFDCGERGAVALALLAGGLEVAGRGVPLLDRGFRQGLGLLAGLPGGGERGGIGLARLAGRVELESQRVAFASGAAGARLGLLARLLGVLPALLQGIGA